MIMHRKNCFHEECYFQKIASPKISIIVPVYNPGNGFARCLKSLQEQKVTDIEIILIDDCSTDGSMELGRNAALKDKRIRILVNEENRGAGFSRNRGIEEASGEYLAFVDPDDYIAADFLELLYNKATESHPDIVKGEVNQVSISGKVNDGSNEKSLNQKIREGLQKGIPLYRLFSYNHWTAIYNRLFLLRTGARYGLTRNSQDTAFLLRTCYFTNFIDFADSAKYYYVARADSRVRDYRKERLQQELLAYKDLVSFFQDHEMDENFYPYIIGKTEYLLRIQAWVYQYYSKSDGEWFLNEIQHETESLPFADIIQSINVKMEGLIKYGVNLSLSPYRMQGENPHINDRYDVVKRWTDFLCTHPECIKKKKYKYQAIDAYVNLLSDPRIKDLDAVERKNMHSAARSQFRRLPRISRDTHEIEGIYIFISTGINVFQVNKRIRIYIFKTLKMKDKIIGFLKKRLKYLYKHGKRWIHL